METAKRSQPTPSIKDNNRSGPQQKPDPKKPTPRDTVLVVVHNDRTDCDNEFPALISQKSNHEIRKDAEYKDAILSHIDTELKKVDPVVSRIRGDDMLSILVPLCDVLFKSHGLVDKNTDSIKGHFKRKEDFEDLKKVLDKHRHNKTSVVITAALNKRMIDAILEKVSVQEFMDELPLYIHKSDGKNGIEKIREKYPEVTIDKKWLREQLKSCMRYPITTSTQRLMNASIKVGKLNGNALRSLLMYAGLLGEGDEMHLNTKVLDQLVQPLAPHMEHPEWLVNRKGLQEDYERIMVPNPRSIKRRYGEIMNAMEKALEADDKEIAPKIHRGGYERSIKAGKAATLILFFGGASMTMLASLACDHKLGSKIEYVGQGGTLDPRINLTGNSFNFDLNPYAVYRVLMEHTQGEHGLLRSFELGTTELCNHVLYDCIMVTEITGHSAAAEHLRNRVAAFGIMDYRINPEETIKNPEKNAQLLEKQGPIKQPDLTAFLAGYSPKFRAKYCRPHHPAYMYIIEMEDLNDSSKIGVKRVKFSKKSWSKTSWKELEEERKGGRVTSKGEEVDDEETPYDTKGRITLYLPKVGVKEEKITDLEVLKEYLDDCTKERKKRVGDALGFSQRGTSGTGSAAAGRARNSPADKHGSTTREPSSKPHPDDDTRRSRPKSRPPRTESRDRHASPSAHSDSPTAPNNDAHRSRSNSRQPRSTSRPAAGSA